MDIKVDMTHKPGTFSLWDCCIVAVERVSPATFRSLLRAPLADHECVAKHSKELIVGPNPDSINALVLHDGTSKDALVVCSVGYCYCRNAGYVPDLIVSIEQKLEQAVHESVTRLDAEQYISTEGEYGKVFLPWDDLSRQMGFEVSAESGLRPAAAFALGKEYCVRGCEFQEDGISIELFPSAVVSGDPVPRPYAGPTM